MTTQKTRDSLAYTEQIRKINQELKAYTGILSAIIPLFLLFAGIVLLLCMRKHSDVPHGWIIVGLVILLVVLFVLWEIKEYRKNRCFVVDFYSVQLPSMLRKAYAAYDPRISDPDPAFFDSAETWRLPSTVTFLVLSMNSETFRAQGIYRIHRKYVEAVCSGDEDNVETGKYRVSQNLIWKVKVQDVKTDDATQAERSGKIHQRQLRELRDKMGRFLIEYDDDMLGLSFVDFAPIDTDDTKNIRCRGMPDGLSAEHIAESVQQLDFFSIWLERFSKEEDHAVPVAAAVKKERSFTEKTEKADKKFAPAQKLSKEVQSKSSSRPGRLRTVAENMYVAFGLLMFLSIPLFIIGKALGADRPFELFLCLPLSLSAVPVCLLFPFLDLARGAAKKEGYVRVPKVTFAACFIAAFFAFLILFVPTTRDLIASFGPPSIELTHLSAEYRKGKDAVSENVGPAPDEWKLSGIGSGGMEYELSIDEDDWDRLEKTGTLYAESWDVYRMGFDDNVRLVGHWLPGSGKLIDWKIKQAFP